MIVLDTNALLWWINDSGRLSGKARKIIEEGNLHSGEKGKVGVCCPD